MAEWPLNVVIARCDALAQAGQVLPAIGLYQLWLKESSHPLRYVAWFNLSVLLGQIKQYVNAEEACREALRVNPALHQARLNLGHHLENLGRIAEAWQAWKQVETELGTSYTAETQELLLHALNNLARTLETQRQYDQAEAYLVKSLKVDANQSSVLSHYVHLRQKQCKWPVYEPPLSSITVNQMLLATSALASLAATDDPGMQLLAAREFLHNKVQKPVAPRPKRSRKYGDKIKIGYLSGDLCMHAVGLLTVELFELHDRSKFEVYGFCWSKEDGSPLRARIVNAFDHLIKIGHLEDIEAAKVIDGHEIDILVDLQGLTNGARPNILMHRPAGAIQISYLGLPATSALPTVDYILADDYVFPPALEPYMTEKPLRISGCYQVSDRKREVGPPLNRSQCGLPEDKFVYAAFNNNYKITPQVFATWMFILQQVPDSVLWLMADNQWSESNLRAQAAAQGVDPQRLIFAGRAQPPEYMARLALPDLFLDTFPYNAGTTANDILWMGTPILTCSGATYISRMCGSLLTAVGLSELITSNLDDYLKMAVLLGKNSKRVASYKRYLAEYRNESGLFNQRILTANIEHAFEKIVGGVTGALPSQKIAPSGKSVRSQTDSERPFRLQVEGWRGINHSFALVNQFQLLEMVRMPNLEIRHFDTPFRFLHWNRSSNGAGFDVEDEAAINAISSLPFEGGSDAVYRIASPMDLRPTKDRGRLVVFGVTELGLDEASLVPGSDIPSFEVEGGVIVTPSNWSRDRIIEFGFSSAAVHVVPHAADPKYFYPLPQERRLQQREVLGIRREEVVLLNIGAALWNKGIDVLLKGFALARQKRKDIRLIFKDQRNTYGLPGDQYVQATLMEAGLWSDDLLQAITLLPTNLAMDRMVDIYGVADVYVSPYRAEGFNLPVCEAMACGTPVIVTDGGATDDFLIEGIGQKIESVFNRNVKIQDKLIGAYCEPKLDHLVDLLLRVEQKETDDIVGDVRSRSGWFPVVTGLLEICKGTKVG